MGGGATMRAAAKVAGIGVMKSARRGGATSATLRPATASVANSPADQTGGLKIEQAVQRPVLEEYDDWDFADHDGLVVDRVNNGSTSPRLVFGPVPSLEEAKEATSELKDALDKVYFSSPKSSGSADSHSSLQETKACITHVSSVPTGAMQAYKLLNENPAAQTVVASIACDPNVWNAVMQNPALVKYLESERKCATGAELERNESLKSSVGSTDAEEPGKPEGLMGFFEDVKITVLDIVDSVTNFVQSLFAEPDATQKSGSSEGAARSIFAGGALMGLAVMVIMMVALRRA